MWLPWAEDNEVMKLKWKEAEASEERMVPGRTRRSDYAARIIREEFFAKAPAQKGA